MFQCLVGVRPCAKCILCIISREPQHSSHFAEEEIEYRVVTGIIQGQTAKRWVEIQTQVIWLLI